MSITKTITRCLIGSVMVAILLFCIHYNWIYIGVGAIILTSVTGLGDVLIRYWINHNKKIDYNKINIIESESTRKNIASKLSKKELAEQHSILMSDAQNIVASLSKWELNEIGAIDIYRRRSMGNTIFNYTPSDNEQYKQLQNKLLRHKAIDDSLLPLFTSLGNKVCELVAKKTLIKNKKS